MCGATETPSPPRADILRLAGNTAITCTRMDNAIANINREHSTDRLPQGKPIARSFSAGGNMCMALRINLNYTAHSSGCLGAPQRKSLRNSELNDALPTSRPRRPAVGPPDNPRIIPAGNPLLGIPFSGARGFTRCGNIANRASGPYSPGQYIAEPDTGRPFIPYALPAVGMSSSCPSRTL